MRSLCWVVGALIAVAGLSQAQPLPDRETLARTPLDEAIVLDPVGEWERADSRRKPGTPCTALDQQEGNPVATVTAPGRFATWQRRLRIPVDVRRYPFAVLTYRARGIEPSDEPCVSLILDRGTSVTLLRNREVTADGETHEASLDLRDDALEPGTIVALALRPHCGTPGPAVVELLGLRFESDHDLPPLDAQEEPEFAVRVVDLAGDAIAGAMVTLDAERLNATRTAMTDAKGMARLRAANNPAAEHTLQVAKAGMATAAFSTEGDAALPERVALVPAVRYAGCVRNEAGEPVPRVVVGLLLLGSGIAGYEMRRESLLADEGGRWQSSLLPTEPPCYGMALDHPEYATTRCAAPPVQQLRAGTAVLTIKRGVVVRGTVLRPDGHPMGGVHLMRQYGEPESVWTDARGRFAFSPSSGSQVSFVVEADGFAPAAVNAACAPGMADLEVRLQPGALRVGRVVDPAGNPVPGASVQATEWRGSKCLSWQTATDAEGAFIWCDAPADTVHLSIAKSGYMTLSHQPLAATEEEQRIVLPPPLRVTGTVRDAKTGEPVPGARLIRGERWSSPQSSVIWSRPGSSVGADGSFALTFASCAGGLLIQAEAPGYAAETLPDLVLGTTELALDIPLRRTTDIAGTVYLPDGKLAAGVTVCMVGERDFFGFQGGRPMNLHMVASQETGEDGRYQLPDRQGKWVLVAFHPLGYAEASSDSWQESPELRLEAWGRIEGTYQVGSRPTAGQTIQVQPAYRWPGPDGSITFPMVRHQLTATTDERGGFCLEHVPPGEGRVNVYLDQGRRRVVLGHTQQYVLPPGGVAAVTMGGTGCPVLGRLALPPGDATAVDWEASEVTLRTWVDVAPVRPPLPTQWDALPLGERQARFQKWLRTWKAQAYGKSEWAFLDARRQADDGTVRSYGLALRDDGSFRGDDIPAGHYLLSVQLYAPRGDSEQFFGAPLGIFEHEVTIPELPGGRSDEPFDLGERVIKGLGRDR